MLVDDEEGFSNKGINSCLEILHDVIRVCIFDNIQIQVHLVSLD
jgi:hypothetical protein